MIITAPLRRMILQRSQRGLTEVRIFMGSVSDSQAALQSLFDHPAASPPNGAA
jgi:hypothetical protein